MKHTSQEERLSAVLQFNPQIPLAEAETPPSSWYLSEDFFQLEKEAVFMRGWVGIGDGSTLQQAGDFITGELIDEPYVVVNNPDASSTPLAFFNVCPHKAAQVATGSGRCEKLVCPYHGWEYGLDGSLSRATSLQGIKNFKARDHGLRPIHLEKFGKTLFLNFAEKAESPLAQLVAPIEQAMQAFRLDHTFRDLTLITRRHYPMHANWKLYIENFNDGDYHIPYLHPSLKDWSYSHTDELKYYGKLILQLSEHPAEEEGFGLGGVYSYLYPNTMVGRSGETSHVIMAFPISACETIMTIDSYIRTDLAHNEAAVKEALDFIERLHLEDIMICESITKGLRSRSYDKGRYAPSKEKGIHYFHQLLFEDLCRTQR